MRFYLKVVCDDMNLFTMVKLLIEGPNSKVR